MKSVVILQTVQWILYLLLTTTSVESNSELAKFPKGFFFGLATAPAQTEDQLDDMWLDFAENNHVPQWSNYKKPEERIKFWYVRTPNLFAPRMYKHSHIKTGPTQTRIST